MISSNSTWAFMRLFTIFVFVVGLWASIGWRALGAITGDIMASNEERRQKVRGSLKKYRDLYYDEEVE